ncbi:DUF6339 family protein [Priestia megaterium]|uniref:DUF6339 family protein n=1 Tax=Priestia megaterium TaxID=1404 RepID=UPI00203A70B7|nr:DUF6339 family protein [Priestia megaterium]MCM3186378.1 DUF6339 family protein [Priestia megaterium]
MKIHYLKDSSLDRLKSDIIANTERYSKNTPWLNEYFEGEDWSLVSKVVTNEIILKNSDSPRRHYDADNAISIHKALDLTITQAIDERLWAYLTHVTFWDYMKNRWNVSKLEKPKEVIKERYFFGGGDRRFTRNGIARLWWAAQITKDETRDDPYELTKILFTTQDIAQNLLERNFSRNTDLSKSILSVLSKMDPQVYKNAQRYRELMKYFNSLGGVTILDSLTESDIKKIIEEKLGAALVTA